MWSRITLIARMLAILPLSLFRAGRMILSERKAVVAMHPMAVALGSWLAIIGIKPHQYKASKIAP